MISLVTPSEPDLPALSALCLRSKAFWGYDAEFIEACRDELTLSPKDLIDFQFQVAVRGDVPLGLTALGPGPVAELELLFIDPPAMNLGLGRRLFDWSAQTARGNGAKQLRIVADPGARSFYEHMGAYLTGDAPSGSIPGRSLPVLHFDLETS